MTPTARPLGRVLPDGSDLCRRLAPWIPVSQSFVSYALTSPGEHLRSQLHARRDDLGLFEGARVAVAVGSRGIANLRDVVAALVDTLHEFGAAPFIVPAMGSHGGGTAQGQAEMLESLSITEETVGAPVRSSMETVRIGVVGSVEVHIDKLAVTEADVIIPVARIKPHTDFRGPVESGILKMLAVGLGKHRGADSVHRVPPSGLSEAITSAGVLIMQHAPVTGAIAIVEDAYDRIGKIEVVLAREVIRREPELLRLAFEWMPSLPFEDVDILVVDEMGKDISGPGMDPNVTGRYYAPRPGVKPNVGVLVALSLTDASHGNATGLGMADVVTQRLAESIDWRATYTNEVASRMLAGPKLPVVAADDEDALAVATHCLGLTPPEKARIAWIKNTLTLSRIRMSLPLWDQLKSNPALQQVGPAEPPRFLNGQLQGAG